MIVTQRLILRPHKEGEAYSLSTLFGDWNVSKWFWTPHYPYTTEHAQAEIATNRADHLRGRFNGFAIALKNDDALVGGIMFDIDPAPEWKDEVSYWIGSPYWGRGFASEALMAAVHFAKNTQNRTKLWAVPDQENKASLRVLEKCGFHFVDSIKRVEPSRTGGLWMQKYQIDF